MATFVVCIDGTWNEPGQTDIDPLTGRSALVQTNVLRTWEALTGDRLHEGTACYGAHRPLQQGDGEALYFNGVGSEGPGLERAIQGMTGSGTSRRIKDAYRFLYERWSPGDRIFCFGFSRGAFAVRSLCGLLDRTGLPKTRALLRDDYLSDLYEGYRAGDRRQFDSHTPCEVSFLGVWDTVGALAFGQTFRAYHRVNPRNVKRICHALALDEFREQFAPTFYQPDETGTQSIQEVWFVGAHSNIGGGYSDANLSNIALFWILSRAVNAGLVLDLRSVPGFVDERHAPGRPSYVEFWNSIRGLGEIVQTLGLGKQRRAMVTGQRIHESVAEAKATAGYQPATEIRDGVEVEEWGV